MVKILFVCHGNICRSPMAEFIMKDLVKKAGLEQEFHIESAATSTEEIGNPVYPPARRKLAQHGISCEGKRARQLRREDYEDWRSEFSPQAETEKSGLCFDEVADPWYTGDFEATWQDVLAGCRGLLAAVTED